MNVSLTLAGAAVRAAGAVSPRWGGAVALSHFRRVARPRPVTADDGWTMLKASRSSVRIPGIDRRGVDVVTYEWGRGTRIAVLAHGWEGRASQFATLVRELVAEGFRVVAFDAPAHGDSPGRGTYVIDWIDVLDRLQRRHGRFDLVVGHSFAGFAAMVAAAGGLQAGRIVTIGAPAEAATLMRGFQRMLRFSDQVLDVMSARFAARYFPGDADPYVRLSTIRRPLPAGVALLVMHDGADRVVPFAEAARIAAANPAARTLATQGLGHYRILTADSTLDAVLAFVEQPVRGVPVPAPAPAPSIVG